MIKKRIQMKLDFTIEIDENGVLPEMEEGNPRDYNAPQRNLLKTLIANKQIFDRYVLLEAITYLECIDPKEWASLVFGLEDGCNTEEILKDILPFLTRADRKHFKECIDEGIFYENTEHFSDCFSTSLDQIEIHSFVNGEK